MAAVDDEADPAHPLEQYQKGIPWEPVVLRRLTRCPPSSPLQRLQRQQPLPGSICHAMVAWAPQLSLCATAIARVSGKPPVGTWLNLPLEGSAVRVMGVV